MTSTPVKDVSLMPGSPPVSAGTKMVSGGGFQTVLNDRTGKETTESQTDSSKTTAKKTPGESLKARDVHRKRLEESGQKEPVEGAEQPGPEQLEEAMAVLGTAAQEMLTQIADTLGVDVQEVVQAMEELGMDSLDVLDPKMLSNLVLQLGGAADAYELVTNGELYENYQALMGQLKEVLGQSAEQLSVEEEQLPEMLEQLKTPEEVPTEIPIEVTVEEAPRETEEQPVSEEPVQGQTQNPEATQTRETNPEEGRESRGGRERQEGEKEPAGLFAEQMRQTQFQPQTQAAQGMTSAWRADTQDIMRQIMDYMRINVKAEVSNLEMQLHPASLGTLQIQIASRGGVVTANFITQNEAVKTALEGQMVQLQQHFEEQGVKVEAIQVTVQTHEFERNLEQGRGRHQEEAPRKNRTRRINLSDPISGEEAQEEDALAAELLAASGNTMDIIA